VLLGVAALRADPEGAISCPRAGEATWSAASGARSTGRPPASPHLDVGAQGCDTQEHCARLAAAVEAPRRPGDRVNDAACWCPRGLDAGSASSPAPVDRGGRRPAGEVLFAGGWGWCSRRGKRAGHVARRSRRPWRRTTAVAATTAAAALLAHSATPTRRPWPVTVNDEPPPQWGPAAPAVFAPPPDGSPLASGRDAPPPADPARHPIARPRRGRRHRRGRRQRHRPPALLAAACGPDPDATPT